ncbi:hypothetical protein Acy02nite_77310 [Actinoplanes cyaneus]|uniref:Uncharacterized protein n=1 Tax=Actinoplanes cyaneus TaxID=52696 RepID=A0A919IXG1_9ACTN|nr:hypothetical protein Acy02nite_77310 [Actinoplanes cyaneus]
MPPAQERAATVVTSREPAPALPPCRPTARLTLSPLVLTVVMSTNNHGEHQPAPRAGATRSAADKVPRDSDRLPAGA